jgi:hypothetical protein
VLERLVHGLDRPTIDGSGGVRLPLLGDVASRSATKSTVSARLVTATGARLDELRERSLAERPWLVAYVDDFVFPGQLIISALGIDAEGNKVPL